MLRAAQETFRLMKESPYHAAPAAMASMCSALAIHSDLSKKGWIRLRRRVRQCWVPLVGDKSVLCSVCIMMMHESASPFAGTRRLPSDVALNDELYPRTFGAVWPSSSFPYAEFLESNFEVFLEELQSIMAEEPCCLVRSYRESWVLLTSRCRQEGLFEQLRRAARNAEGLAVWPPDTCQHGENAVCCRKDLDCLLQNFDQYSCEGPVLRCCWSLSLEPGIAWLELGRAEDTRGHIQLLDGRDESLLLPTFAA